MFCKNCGKEVNDNAVMCIHCGCAVSAPKANVSDDSTASPKSKMTALLLCFFLGYLGVHRFYVGKTGIGILMFLTVGCCGILTLIDFINIAMGNFTDSDGLKLTK